MDFDNCNDLKSGCLIFAQADLFGEASADDVEKWTEKVVAEIIGEAPVKKWRY